MWHNQWCYIVIGWIKILLLPHSLVLLLSFGANHSLLYLSGRNEEGCQQKNESKKVFWKTKEYAWRQNKDYVGEATCWSSNSLFHTYLFKWSLYKGLTELCLYIIIAALLHMSHNQCSFPISMMFPYFCTNKKEPRETCIWQTRAFVDLKSNFSLLPRWSTISHKGIFLKQTPHIKN